MVQIYNRKKSKQPWVNQAASFDIEMLELIDSGVRDLNTLAEKLNASYRKVYTKTRQYQEDGVIYIFDEKLYIKPL